MQLSFTFEAAPLIRQVRDRLLVLHGPQRDALRHDPMDQLVKAMISSCTRDAVSDAAFAKLLAVMPSWDPLPDADPAAIACIIQNVTYASDKAVHLVAATHIIKVRCGRLDLSFLADWQVEDALSWLDHLPGVGAKIAAVTLNFSALRRRALAVDRHVLRVSKCLGLVPGRTDFEGGFRILMRLVPNSWDADDLYELHWLMKAHGQQVCRHPQPIRDECPLASLCLHHVTTH